MVKAKTAIISLIKDYQDSPKKYGGHDAHQDHSSHSDHSKHNTHADHSGHEMMFRNRFWVSLALSVPVLLYSPTL